MNNQIEKIKLVLRSLFPRIMFSVIKNENEEILVSIWREWLGKIDRDILFEISPTNYNCNRML
jgi:hypothetical protein